MLELNIIRGRLVAIQRKRKVLRMFTVFNAVCLLVAVACVSGAFLISSRTAVVRGKLAKYKTDIQANKLRYNVEDLETQWIQHLSGLTLINEVLNHRTSRTEYLLELARLTPLGICIQHMAFAPGEVTQYQVILDAMAISGDKKAFERVDSLISGLEKSPLFGAGVKLESHERRNVGDKEMELFKIKIPVRAA